MSGGKGGGDVTVGYRYYMGFLFGLCHGPVDALLKIAVGDREAWSGSQTASGQIYIDAPNLFGGDEREGGVQGYVDVQMGESTQAANAYLEGAAGTPQPGYRGIVTTVARKILFAAMNPYPKTWAWKVRRITSGWDGTPWYSAKASIALDNGDTAINPAHIVYQCLTNREWGMGYDAGQIDATSFTAAADTFYSEGLGLCMQWTRQGSIESFLQVVVDHAGAVVTQDRTTGLFVLHAIRSFSSPGSLPLFDPSNCTLESWQRPAIAETVNEIVLTYTESTTGQDGAVSVQNLANIQAQGGVVSQPKGYPGLPCHSLAARVAERDLRVASTPLAKFKIKTNRKAYSLLPGSGIRFSWPNEGVTEVVLRILNIDYGTLRDGVITIDAAEDVFNLPASSYASKQASVWTAPDTSAHAPALYDTMEATYRDLVRGLGQVSAEAADAAAAYVFGVAAKPSGVPLRYRLHTKLSTATDYLDVGVGNWCPTGLLSADIGPTATAITLTSGSGLANVQVGRLALLGSEIVRVDAITPGTGAVTIARGCVDTVPQPSIAAGTRMWFFDGWAAPDSTEYISGETINAKFQTVSTSDILDIASAPADSVTVAARQNKPYPPGKLRLNTLAYPASIASASVTVAWTHRDRVLQADQVLTEADASVGPEAGTTYNLRLYNAATGVLLKSYTGLGGTSQSVSIIDTMALLHMDGTGGSTTFTDESGIAWTASGNAQISTAQSKFGGASALFDGTGDYVTSDASDGFVFGTGDLTLECWIYAANTSAGYRGIASDLLYSAAGGWALYQNGTALELWRGGLRIVNATGAISATTWHHVAWTRAGNTHRLFVDGVQVGGSGTDAVNFTNNRVMIGKSNAGAYYFNGHIDEFRIKKGVALYTGTFTPPAAAFTIDAAIPASVRVEVESVRGGVVSHQAARHTWATS